jgi:DNA-binding ferritin-like protein
MGSFLSVGGGGEEAHSVKNITAVINNISLPFTSEQSSSTSKKPAEVAKTAAKVSKATKGKKTAKKAAEVVKSSKVKKAAVLQTLKSRSKTPVVKAPKTTAREKKKAIRVFDEVENPYAKAYTSKRGMK